MCFVKLASPCRLLLLLVADLHSNPASGMSLFSARPWTTISDRRDDEGSSKESETEVPLTPQRAPVPTELRSHAFPPPPYWRGLGLRLAQHNEQAAQLLSLFWPSLLSFFLFPAAPSLALRLDFLYDGLCCYSRAPTLRAHSTPLHTKYISAITTGTVKFAFLSFFLSPCRASSRSKRTGGHNAQPASQSVSS